MRANSGSVITTLCALAGVVGLCMTTFGNANIGLTSFNLLLHLKAACRTFLPPERFPCLQSERKRRHLYGQVSAEWQAGGQILALYIEQVELNFYFIDFFECVLVRDTQHLYDEQKLVWLKQTVESLFLQKNLKGCSHVPICQSKCYTMQTFLLFANVKDIFKLSLKQWK